MPLWLPIALLAAFAAPLVAQDADSLPPTPVHEDEPDEEDEEDGPNLKEFLDAVMAEAEAARGMTPSEVAQGDSAPGVQAGGTEIRLRVDGTPETLVRDDPDDQRDAPSPPVYGEEICPTGNVRGQFEPAQGVWQDDPTFPDRPGKQIVRLSPVLWRAELPMVTGRRTLLFGIQRAPGAEPRRDEIFIRGEATGTDRIPVKFRFTVKQTGGQRVVYESEIVKEIPIGGPCRPGAVVPFEVPIDVHDGVPPSPVSFAFDEDGEYLIEAELVTPDGRPTGIKVGVLGRSVTTYAPSIAFRIAGILGSTLDPQFLPELEEKARTVRNLSSRRLPDYLPVRNERLKTRLFPVLDRSDLLDVFARQPTFRELRAAYGEGFLEKAIREELMRQMQVDGLMTGYDRLVVLMGAGDIQLLWAGSFHQDAYLNAAAFAPSQKVVFVNLDWYGDHLTVAHELIHTFPYSFASPQMLAECGIDYHNVATMRVGHGHRIMYGPDDFRQRMDNSRAIMGPAYSTKWITQCTYRHVLEYLSRGQPDPRVILVQGFVGRTREGDKGLLLPFYDLDGVEDLPRDGAGGWSIVLRDAEGNVLARHAWEPQWQLPDTDVERDLVAFAFRLLRPQGLARVDLEGPAGRLASKALSATPPEVAIRAPAANVAADIEGGRVRVEWTGSDVDGDSLLFTVLYSPDAGATWMDVLFESPDTSVLAPIDSEAPAGAHRVLVRATDGSRSADAVVEFRVSQ